MAQGSFFTKLFKPCSEKF